MNKILRKFKMPAKLSMKGMLAVGLAVLLLAVLVVAAVVADPYEIPDKITLEGCNLDHGGTFDPNTLICSLDAYTTGNLGKSWAELDFVPHRVTLENSSGVDKSYGFVVSGDYTTQENGYVGWQDITELILNVGLSEVPDGLTAADACQVSTGPLSWTAPDGGVGGAYETIYREAYIDQLDGTTCVYDYAQQLAIGASLYSGSSLQSNLWNLDLNSSGIGQKRIQLPVNEIDPQEIDKDMTASQDAEHIWNLTKEPMPATLTFNNTCSENQADLQQGLQIAIRWERLPASPTGAIDVVTNIEVTNPAHIAVTVDVTDVIYSGTIEVDTASSGPVVVPANTTMNVFTHQFAAPADATELNDVATATYAINGTPMPGQTTATASADVQPGSVLDQMANIYDDEWIAGAPFSFSADSFAPDVGDFDAPYIAGTPTTEHVFWTSDVQSGDGMVTFDKTVYVGGPTEDSGTLFDHAWLVGLDGFGTDAYADVAIQTAALFDLTINKSIPDVLQGAETESFTFQVTGPDSYSEQVTINFAAGETSKSSTLYDLKPGTYTVTETGSGSGKWALQDPQDVTLALPDCVHSVTFRNSHAPARAKVKKVTIPAGSEADWDFTLSGPGGPVYASTTGTGFVEFSLDLQEGSYTITETPKPGWDETGSTGCAFTVDYPGDAGAVFECTKENTQRGKILVDKVTDPTGATQAFEFDASYYIDNFFLADADPVDDSGYLVPASYSVGEVNIPGDWDLTDSYCETVAGTGISVDTPASITLEPGETVKCTFEDTQRGKILVDKVTDPTGATQAFEFDASYYIDNFFLADADPVDDSGYLEPDLYSVGEVNIPGDWDLTDSYCETVAGTGISVDTPASITLEPGETVKCTFEDTQRGKILVDKVTDPTGATQAFEFDASYYIDNFFLADADPVDDSGYLVPASYSVGEVNIPGDWDLTDSYCETVAGTGISVDTPASITLEPGETVKCTFEDTQRGKILVDKVTDPTGATQAFEFDASYYIDNFFLADADPVDDSGYLVPASYSVGEVNIPGDWDLTDSYCETVAGTGISVDTPASITLEPGETVKCTFEDTQRGKILVDKVTDPTGATQAFEFDASYYIDNFFLADADPVDDSGYLEPDLYSVGEVNIPGDWDLTDSYCETVAGTGISVDTPASITLEPGETVKCTFEDTQRGKILVDKVTDPTGATQAFEFDASYYIDNFFLADADPVDDSGYLVPASYSVGEVNIPGDWDLTDSYCETVAGTGISVDTPASITLEPGETVKCTFEDTQRGKILVDKVTDPTGATQAFEFDASYYIDNFFLADADPVDDSGYLVPTSYSVGEVNIPGDWDLTDSYCETVAGTGISVDTPASITLEPGETVKCTFEDTQRGKILVDKVTDPTGATQAFEFDASYYIDNFFLADADPVDDSGYLVPASYSVGEVNIPGDWDLTDSYCETVAGTGISVDTPASITLEPGETVKCTFEDTQRGKILVDKVTDPTGATQAFEFDASYYIDNFFLADADPVDDSGYLEPDLYSVGEVNIPGDWDLTDSYCETVAGTGISVDTPASITLEPGETVKCTFEDTQRGRIIINKETRSPSDILFEFQASYYGAPFYLMDGGQDDTGWEIQPGAYDVTEIEPFGWKLDDLVCDDPSGGTTVNVDAETAYIDLAAGETVECWFVNEQLYLGYTPGFWKNHGPDTNAGPVDDPHNAWQYTEYYPDDPFCSVFAQLACDQYPFLNGVNLMQALSLRGGDDLEGAAEILARHAVAALLSANINEVQANNIPEFGDYPVLTQEVIDLTNAAFESLDRQTMLDQATVFDMYNNGGSDYFDWDGWQQYAVY